MTEDMLKSMRFDRDGNEIDESGQIIDRSATIHDQKEQTTSKPKSGKRMYTEKDLDAKEEEGQGELVKSSSNETPDITINAEENPTGVNSGVKTREQKKIAGKPSLGSR